VKPALARSLEDQLSFEAHEQALRFEPEDVREELAAVRERRKPEFAGRRRPIIRPTTVSRSRFW
jgi:hypothetical protein